MKLGTENRKSVYALVVLGVIAAYMVYSQLLSGPSSTPAPVAAPRTGDTADTPAPVEAPATAEKSPSGPDISRAGQQGAARPGGSARNGGEFHPVLRAKKKEDRIARIADIDPTLRLDLLAKVMRVAPAGGDRDLFQILKGPPVKETAALKGPEPKVPPPFVGPRPPPPPPPPQPPRPPAPPEPIPLKYYAYSTIHPDGKRTAYFLDGDEPLAADEGTTLKGRYRIVRIGLDKVLVEDLVQKRQQSINIEPEGAG
jgi:hypothetical protein